MGSKKYLVDFGMAKAVLDIQSDTSLTFTILEKEGSVVDVSETVEIKKTEIRRQLYLITWKEASGNTVIQVQDYEREIVYSNWVMPDGECKSFQGTLKLQKEESFNEKIPLVIKI